MSNEQFKFRAEDFWNLLDKQQKRCALSNRELTPLNCEVELINPNKKDGRFNLDNFYLIDKDLKYLCRYLSEDEVIDLCAIVIKHRGKEKGYSIKNTKA